MSRERRLARQRDRAFRRVMARRKKALWKERTKDWHFHMPHDRLPIGRLSGHPSRYNRGSAQNNYIRNPTRAEVISEISFQEQIDEFYNPSPHASEYELRSEMEERLYKESWDDGWYLDPWYDDQDLSDGYSGYDATYPPYSDYYEDYYDYEPTYDYGGRSYPGSRPEGL